MPQGSVLESLKFIAYTVVEEHNVDPYLYADDSQINDHLLLPDVGTATPRMENCMDAVYKWCASKPFQLRPSKTEVIWFGTNANPKKLRSVDLGLHVEAGTIVPVDAVRDLGVILDGELTMAKHIVKITSVCYSTFGA